MYTRQRYLTLSTDPAWSNRHTSKPPSDSFHTRIPNRTAVYGVLSYRLTEHMKIITPLFLGVALGSATVPRQKAFPTNRPEPLSPCTYESLMCASGGPYSYLDLNTSSTHLKCLRKVISLGRISILRLPPTHKRDVCPP